MKRLTLAVVLCIAAMPALAEDALLTKDGGNNLHVGVGSIAAMPKAYSITIGDALVIDMKTRTITVKDGVSTDDAAKRVIEALRPYLESMK